MIQYIFELDSDVKGKVLSTHEFLITTIREKMFEHGVCILMF